MAEKVSAYGLKLPEKIKQLTFDTVFNYTFKYWKIFLKKSFFKWLIFVFPVALAGSYLAIEPFLAYNITEFFTGEFVVELFNLKYFAGFLLLFIAFVANKFIVYETFYNYAKNGKNTLKFSHFWFLLVFQIKLFFRYLWAYFVGFFTLFITFVYRLFSWSLAEVMAYPGEKKFKDAIQDSHYVFANRWFKISIILFFGLVFVVLGVIVISAVNWFKLYFITLSSVYFFLTFFYTQKVVVFNALENKNL